MRFLVLLSVGRISTDAQFLSQVREGESPLAPEQSGDSLLDLISGYGQEAEKKGEAAGSSEAKKKSGKGKGGEK